jgi:hypothetical protein
LLCRRPGDKDNTVLIECSHTLNAETIAIDIRPFHDTPSQQGVCVVCYVRSFRIARNVCMAEKHKLVLASQDRKCIGWSPQMTCDVLKDITNTSVCMSSNGKHAVLNSRCFQCHAKRQRLLRMECPWSFLRSRVDNIASREKTGNNNRTKQNVSRKRVYTEIHQLITSNGGDIEERKGGPCVYCKRITELCPSGALKRGKTSRNNSGSLGVMFSVDHGRPDLPHTSPNQVLQVTCIMCNYLMSSSDELERQLLLAYLRFQFASPFSGMMINEASETRVRALKKVYADILHRNKRLTNEQPLISFSNFYVWLNTKKDTCSVSQVVGHWPDVELDDVLKLSVDRIDPVLPYNYNNMQVILWRLNMAKNTFPQESIVEYVSFLRNDV